MAIMKNGQNEKWLKWKNGQNENSIFLQMYQKRLWCDGVDACFPSLYSTSPLLILFASCNSQLTQPPKEWGTKKLSMMYSPHLLRVYWTA